MMFMLLQNVDCEPLVSCIILSYNSGNKLYTAIKSVIKQDYKHIELIIADDCSTNFNRSLIENELIGKIDFKILENTSNKGTVKNYNKALLKSKGEYIINLAADDEFVDSNVITKIVTEFQKNDAIILVGQALNKKNGELLNNNELNLINTLDSMMLYRRLLYGNFISGAITYYKKEYFEKYGLFDERYSLIEDWPNILKACRNKVKIRYIPVTTILYSDGGESTRKDKSKRYIEDYIHIIEDEILNSNDNIEKSIFLLRYNKFMIFWLKKDYSKCFFYLDIFIYKFLKKRLKK